MPNITGQNRFLKVLGVLLILCLCGGAVTAGLRLLHPASGSSGVVPAKPVSPPSRTVDLLIHGHASSSPVLVSPDLSDMMTASGVRNLIEIDKAREALSKSAAFWKSRREKGFEAIVLGTSPGDLAIVRMLLESPIWVLADVSPHGFFFLEKGTSPWAPGDCLRFAPKGMNRQGRALWAGLTMDNLTAVGRGDLAAGLLRDLPDDLAETGPVLAARASLKASSGNWEGSASLASKALDAGGGIPARMILVRALIEEGRHGEALRQAERMVEERRDAATLFLLARAANAAGDLGTEIESLSGVVDYGRSHGLPLSASLTYLGQALARNGERGPALRALEEALSDPSLTPPQKDALREMIDHIRPASTGEASRDDHSGRSLSSSNGRSPGE